MISGSNDFQRELSDLKEHYRQLLEEIQELRLRETQYQKHTHDLTERVKELNCLYTIFDLTDKGQSLESILGGAVKIIPAAMQYPDISCACIEWDAHQYRSEFFFESDISYRSQIMAAEVKFGWVKVFYRETDSLSRGKFFLGEEKKLIDEIALHLGNVIARFIADQKLNDARCELEQKARSLEEMNTALKVLLDHQKREKASVEKDILTNLNILVFPYLEKLRTRAIDSDEKALIDIIERNLEEVTKPFAKYFFDFNLSLTPTEIQVAKMITAGYDSKNIAHMLSISESAVNFHRKHIRKKLGLTRQKVNLSAFLQSLFGKEETT